jgi:hypothetical protein
MGDLSEALAWGAAASLAMFAFSLIALPVVLIYLPANYFVRRPRKLSWWRGPRPALRLAGIVAKNLAGVVLVIAGVVMLVTPGQGVLSILVGLAMIDFPGKARFEAKLIGRPAVHHAINRIRAKAGRPPLVLPKQTAVNGTDRINVG